MGFSIPENLLLLLLLIPLTALVLINFRKKKKLRDSFVSDKAFRKMGVRSGREIDFFKASLIIAALIFFVIALAGPEWGEKFENIEVRGIEMVFALDTSNSMNAQDLRPSRLEFSKQLIATIIDNFGSDYIGLVNFAGSAYIQCPLTVDYEAFKLLTQATTISPEEEQGTDFSSAFSLALKSFRTDPESKKIMIFITDGEDQEGKWQDMMPELEKQNVVVFAIGVGNQSGAPIPLKNSRGEIIGWKKDQKGNMIRTRLDEKTLIRMASDTGGQYFRFSDVSAIDIFVNNLKSFERTVLSKTMKLSRQKRFYYPLIIGIICLILEMFLTDKKIQWKKK